MITRGTYVEPLRSLRKNFFAAALLRRRCTRGENMAVLVDGAPEVIAVAIDGQKHLIQVPLVVKPGPLTPELMGIPLPELAAPFADGLIRHDDSSFE
jgi:hypothetical protein